MGKHSTIPQGYMTVGELAKKMNVTVRTIQYYDRIGVFRPSAESEGGRRLYTNKDLMKLHQILSLKYLGFSLDDIKNRIIPLETPADVVEVLTEQADIMRNRIASLSEALDAIEILKDEILQIETVDFRRYAEIIVRLQNGIQDYWTVKKFDDKMLDHIKNRYDVENGNVILDMWERLCNKAAELQKKGVPPESEQGLSVGKAYWDMILEFTGGDMNLLPDLIKFGQNRDGWDPYMKEKYEGVVRFINMSMKAYFEDLGYNPFEEIAEWFGWITE